LDAKKRRSFVALLFGAGDLRHYVYGETSVTYRCLQLNPSTPVPVSHFIARAIEDLYFSDIHAMLRLPLPDEGIAAEQSFAIT
jgi:hypothetical protein